MWAGWLIAYRTVRNDYIIPSFADTMAGIGRNLIDADFWRAFGNTMLRTLYSWLIAFAVSVFSMSLSALSDKFRRFIAPFVSVLRTLPTMAITLMLLTAALELDVALGAFAAGLLLHAALRGAAPEHAGEIMHKVEVLGFSLLIPVFFLTSGMSIDVAAVLGVWPLLAGFVAMILLVRGLPVLCRELWTTTGSELSSVREKAALGLYSATGLPIIVAVTQIAAGSGLITVTTASAMVMAGAITVLVFPLLASRLTRRAAGIG